MTSTTIIAAIINFLINICLIKKIELYAACLSTLIAYASMAIYRYFDVQKYVKVIIYKKTIIISIISFTFSMFAYYERNNIISLALFLLNFVILVMFNKEIIIDFINKVKSKIFKKKKE